MSTIADVLEGRAQWALIQGDCMEVLPTMADRSVAHVITDPPYEAAAHTLQRRVRRVLDSHTQYSDDRPTDNEPLSFEPLSFEPLSEEIREAASLHFARLATRWIAAFCQVEAAERWMVTLEAAGAKRKRIGVWIKPDAMPQFSGDRPGMGYESIVFAHAPGRSAWNGGGRVGVFEHNKNSGGAHVHETQKPLPLMLELVSLFTNSGEVVLDAYAGSGTTGVACLRLGRRFVGIERDPTYAAIARDRLTAESQGQSLREFRAGQMPLFGG